MKQITASKISLCLTGIFVAGAITGAAVGWSSAREKAMKPPSPQKVCGDLREKLKADLNLTPEQIQRINPILERTASQFQTIQKRSSEDMKLVFDRQDQEISEILTDDQRKKMQKLRQERHHFRHHEKGPMSSMGNSTNIDPK